MFIISLSYKVPLEKIDEYIGDHIEYLNKQYEIGNFILSGRKVPRNGGIIISNITNKNEIEQIIEKDPFKINNLANYEIIELTPTKTSNELNFLLDN